MSEHSMALAMRTPQLPAPAEWSTLTEMADVFLRSGLLPASIKTPAAALTIMLKARELSIPPLYGLSNIVVVSGKPTCSSELMLALVLRDHGDNALIVETSTAERCAVSYRRRSWDAPRSYAFTLDDARTAGLAGKGTWAAYPAAMLRARCISAVARMAYADSIGGMYSPDELGAAVRVTHDGEVVIDETETLPDAQRVRVDDAPALPPARPADVDADGVIHRPANAPLLADARALYRRAKALGLSPIAPTNTEDETTVRSWIDHWRTVIDEQEEAARQTAAREATLRASSRDALARDDSPTGAMAKEAVAAQRDEAVAAVRAQGGDTDQDTEDAWEAIKREPTTPKGPRWVATPLGAQVSEIADQLTEAGKKFSLPAVDATDADLEGWIASKRGLLGQTRAK